MNLFFLPTPPFLSPMEASPDNARLASSSRVATQGTAKTLRVLSRINQTMPSGVSWSTQHPSKSSCRRALYTSRPSSSCALYSSRPSSPCALYSSRPSSSCALYDPSPSSSSSSSSEENLNSFWQSLKQKGKNEKFRIPTYPKYARSIAQMIHAEEKLAVIQSNIKNQHQIRTKFYLKKDLSLPHLPSQEETSPPNIKRSLTMPQVLLDSGATSSYVSCTDVSSSLSNDKYDRLTRPPLERLVRSSSQSSPFAKHTKVQPVKSKWFIRPDGELIEIFRKKHGGFPALGVHSVLASRYKWRVWVDMSRKEPCASPVTARALLLARSQLAHHSSEQSYSSHG
jgi:hypothetical protein